MKRPTPSSSAAKPQRATKKKPLKDPQGGLTAAGRAHYVEKENAHLRPGVQGPADTPDKMRRKGSFLRRRFANPRGPLKDQKGNPTRLATSAQAWGEKVPQNAEDTHRLAKNGKQLLTRYQQTKEQQPKATGTKRSLSEAPRKSTATKAAPHRQATTGASATKPAATTKAPRRKTASSAKTYTNPALRERIKNKVKKKEEA